VGKEGRKVGKGAGLSNECYFPCIISRLWWSWGRRRRWSWMWCRYGGGEDERDELLLGSRGCGEEVRRRTDYGPTSR
jgi:hypothetical protein